MQVYFNMMVGNIVVEIYNKLVYNYIGLISWNLVERCLLMWGISFVIGVFFVGLSLECKLYRVVVKVSFWVNGK